MANTKDKKAKGQGGESKAKSKAGSASSFTSYVVIGSVVLMLAVGAAFYLKASAPEELPSSTDASNSESAAAMSKPAPSTAKTSSTKPKDSPFAWSPKTLTVVLPCAGEGVFARKTVISVAESVPGGIGGPILRDIVIVDDGSQPPLSEDSLTDDFRKSFPFKLVRHNRAIGLMGAKSAGAAHAEGDIIVFFDCHVAPQGDWYKKFLEASAENYRRIVVPVITDLDIDTWKERQRASGMAKCYLTWDADFKWVESKSPFMPVLSGGLLGISRRWWNETGGYDAGMKGWGGENTDQSLRSWLCGGEIMSMSNAFVAHMWRRPEDPRTNQNYKVSNLDAIKNKARAVLGWYDDFVAKAAEYPMMEYVGLASDDRGPAGLNKDVSAFNEIRERLKCRPFSWFLWRFRDIYVNGGMLPKETFRLVEEKTGYCLTYRGPMGTHPQGFGQAALLPCDAHIPRNHPQAQRWHPRNKNPATGECCSALGSWNTDQCLQGLSGDSGMVRTMVCDVSGRQGAPWHFTTEADGSGLAPGQIYVGFGNNVRCLSVPKTAEPARMGDNLEGYKLKLAKCKPEGSSKKPRWKMVDVQVPLETQLYEKALKEQPELFVE